MRKALEVVNRFYDATENRKGEGLETILADDMTFAGPIMKTAGARDYIKSTKQFLQMHRATRMLKQFENESDVCSIYEMDIATFAGSMITIELTDMIRVSNGKVATQKIYYDQHAFARAFGMS